MPQEPIRPDEINPTFSDAERLGRDDLGVGELQLLNSPSREVHIIDWNFKKSRFEPTEYGRSNYVEILFTFSPGTKQYMLRTQSEGICQLLVEISRKGFKEAGVLGRFIRLPSPGNDDYTYLKLIN